MSQPYYNQQPHPGNYYPQQQNQGYYPAGQYPPQQQGGGYYYPQQNVVYEERRHANGPCGSDPDCWLWSALALCCGCLVGEACCDSPCLCCIIPIPIRLPRIFGR